MVIQKQEELIGAAIGRPFFYKPVHRGTVFARGPISAIMARQMNRSPLRQISGDRHRLLNDDNWVVNLH